MTCKLLRRRFRSPHIFRCVCKTEKKLFDSRKKQIAESFSFFLLMKYQWHCISLEIIKQVVQNRFRCSNEITDLKLNCLLWNLLFDKLRVSLVLLHVWQTLYCCSVCDCITKKVTANVDQLTIQLAHPPAGTSAIQSSTYFLIHVPSQG